MKVTGLIVEYNPFHNGHLYHLQESRSSTNADIIICVMSGYFLQRGEPALVSRRTRTKMALAGGADIVVELPYAYSVQHASLFSRGAVAVLEAMGADTVVFGSEHGQITPFLELDSFLMDHQAQYESHIQSFVKQGMSYPRASSAAFSQLNPGHDLPDILQPNNILGYNYVKAIRELKAKIKPATIKRIGAGYHEKEKNTQSIASATGIRHELIEKQNHLDAVANTMPSSSFDQLKEDQDHQPDFFHWNLYYPFLQANLLTASSSRLRGIYEAEEGLENRFISHAKQHSSFTAFIEAVKTKRYTWTRLQRLATHILTDSDKDLMLKVLQAHKLESIRLLGMNENGQKYLSLARNEMEIPLATKMNREKGPQALLDEKAALAYFLPLSPSKRIKRYKEEYSLPPVRFVSKEGRFLSN
ncbi:nucleotidyltransferase [Bacillus sp. FJAT-44742]|uniref:nucleotidyltransferase n=1 Tax=Bacillus sp. FJAT-44742 TaxID=2014005 RepID=UPI000C23A655|nr:nucleotidyltransferase [Bacillus sp. FJAT-44742]